MRKTIEEWKAVDPVAIAAASHVSAEFALDDARADILQLHTRADLLARELVNERAALRRAKAEHAADMARVRAAIDGLTAALKVPGHGLQVRDRRPAGILK
jgi:hypothetical protein